MASRESQGLQIALILFVMVTVVLAITTFVLYYKISGENGYKAQVATANTAKAAAEKTRGNYAAGYELVKHTLGQTKLNDVELDGERRKLEAGGGDIWTEVKEIEDQYQKDMAAYGAGLDEDQLNYTALPRNLIETIYARSDAVVAVEAREAKLRQDTANELQIAATNVANAEKARDDAVKTANDLRTAYEADRARFLAKQQELITQVNDLNTQAKADVESAARQVQSLKNELSLVNNTVADLAAKLDRVRNPSYEAPDGRVSWVNHANSVVWINLGLADGVRRQTTFSVINRDETRLQDAQPKGSIEIVRVIDRHLSEARITDETLNDPILPGDLIHSPTFEPGRPVHFAIVGVIDVDGDKKSDRQLVLNLIAASGGVIDAEVDEEGKRTGAISVQTDYLILGERPTEKTSQGLRDAYTLILDEAERFGIESMPVAKLLTYMGYRGEVRTVQLGRGASGEDLGPAEGAPRDVSSGATSGFRSRTPPTRGGKGAY